MTLLSLLLSAFLAAIGGTIGWLIVRFGVVPAAQLDFVEVMGMLGGAVLGWPVNRLLGTTRRLPPCTLKGGNHGTKYLSGRDADLILNDRRISGVILKCAQCDQLVFLWRNGMEIYFLEDRDGRTFASGRYILRHFLLPGKWKKDAEFKPSEIRLVEHREETSRFLSSSQS